MYSSAYVWAKIISYIEDQLGPVVVSAAFDDAEVVELNDEHLIIYSASDFRRDLIRRRYTHYIQDALKDIFNSEAKLMVFGDEELQSFRQKGKSASSMDFNPQFTFENFVVGDCNRESHAASLACACNPGKYFNPLFIYGNSGLGKTHLLMAIGNYVQKNYPNKKIYYIEAKLSVFLVAHDSTSVTEIQTPSPIKSGTRKGMVLPAVMP